ncbi:MAG: hypothetical protein ABIJ86_06445 [Spirochaetota bacterium]
MNAIPIPIFGMFFSLFVLPVMSFGFILIMKKQKTDIEKLRIKKEMMELEIQKESLNLQFLVEENKKYDRIIESRSSN